MARFNSLICWVWVVAMMSAGAITEFFAGVFGEQTLTGLSRGLNALYCDGGILQGSPFC